MTFLIRFGLENAVAASLLAVVALIAGRFSKRSPALVHGLWLLVLLKLVCPPLWIVPVDRSALDRFRSPISMPASEAFGSTIGTTELVVQETHPAQADILGFDSPFAPIAEIAPLSLEIPTLEEDAFAATDPSFTTEGQIIEFASVLPFDADVEEAGAAFPLTTILAVLWGAGSCTAFVLSALSILRFLKVQRLAKPASEGIMVQVEEAAMKIGLRWVPETSLIDWDRPPMVWAFGRRASLMIPTELWRRLDASQREALLIHELAHLKRGDHLVRWFEATVSCLFWWLPVVWLARRGLREAEEDCCDAWVVWALPKSSRRYADTLVETVDFLSEGRSGSPALATGFGQVRHLKRRLKMIMQGSTERRLSLGKTLAIFALGAVLLPVNISTAEPPVSPPAAPAIAPEPPTASVPAVAPAAPSDTAPVATPDVAVAPLGEIRVEVRTDSRDDSSAAIATETTETVTASATSDSDDADMPATIEFRGDVRPDTVTFRGVPDGVERVETFTTATDSDDGKDVDHADADSDVIRETVRQLKSTLEKIKGDSDSQGKGNPQVAALQRAIESLQGVVKKPAKVSSDARSRVVVTRRGSSADARKPAKDSAPAGDVKVRTDEIEGRRKGARAEATERQKDALVQQRQQAEQQLDRARSLARNGNDPAIRSVEGRIERLDSQIERLTQSLPAVVSVRAEQETRQAHDRRLSALEEKLEKVLQELKSLKSDKRD